MFHSFTFTKKNILKTLEDVYTCICAHELAKCIYRKLNVADFQCKHKLKNSLVSQQKTIKYWLPINNAF